ncbi:class I SAM-dependent methyltransferase [Tessaracoccus oleiagri]|uniref:Ubiquinone/menaquinone biosynthesis C-methylase UbiE n=1 Tax=Tessaracoccus oleiagri TaxID=686624 RepID=A0A1G9IAW4_9ACTN|nr:class I SAM-dependent methyltransferase [Tessaracoccus oleiagri]SDL21973.1 Ubiquinone/menaquinone biosynthesis C-methylase UbiE [Tessaracoccus oleiagri]
MHNVRTAFDRGAGRYDLLTSLNPGYHRHLRSAARELRRRIGTPGRHRLMDLACGSGSSTRALLAAGPASILGLDASEGMLAEARRKRWPDGVRFAHAVCGNLDVDSLGPDSRDGIFAAYLFRNVPESTRDAAVRETFDLLRPGGWLVAQEYSVAGDPGAARRWDVISRSIIIPLAVMVDGNPDLYHYLWRSVHEFDSTARFMRRLSDAGFIDVATRTVPGWQRGILHTFVARKPEE